MTSDSAVAISPYLGLSSFEENDRELFHGRELESQELFQTVQRETLTVVFGMSGLGKSSLLRAGLFPRLRDAGVFPIVVRLTYKNRDLVEQIRDAIAREIQKHAIDAEPPTASQTLWEYFHATPFWDDRNRLLVPVLVIDQFEELFTLGMRDAARHALITELADLIENRIPEAVREAGDADALPSGFEQAKAKVILSLREDYLARLEDLRATIPSVARGRFRLRSMDGQQAIRAIRNPRTEHLIEPEVAERVARFVSGAGDDAPLDTITVEPALLSLVCRQLDHLRTRRGEATISTDLLQGESGRILDDFYEQSISGLAPEVGVYLEDHLLTPDGHRTTVALSNVTRIEGMSDAIDKLVDRRILRIEERLGRPHVEVIHDVLTRVMVARKERRAGDAARRRRSSRRIATAVGLTLLAAAIVGAVLYVGARRRLDRSAAAERAAVQRERDRVAASSSSTLVDEATRVLARGDTWSAARLLSVAYGVAGDKRSDKLAMLVHRFTSIDDMLVATLTLPDANVVNLDLADDGSRLVVALTDGTIIIWDRATGKERRLVAPQEEPDPRAGTGSGSGSDAASQAAPTLYAMAITPNGKRVAVRIGPELQLWDVDAAKLLARVNVESSARSPRELRVSHDGDWIAVAGSRATDTEVYRYADGKLATWRRWYEKHDCKEASPDLVGFVTVAFSRGSKAVAISDERAQQTAVWRLPDDAKGEPELAGYACMASRFLALEHGARWLVRGPEPERAACHDDYDCERSLSNANVLYELRDEKLVPASIEGSVIRFDSQQPGVALVKSSSGLERLNLMTRERTQLHDACDATDAAHVLAGGRLISTADCGFVMDDGKSVLTGSLPLEGSTAIAGVGRLVAVAQDGVVRLWKLERSRDPIVSRPSNAPEPLATANIAAGGTWDGTLAASSDGKTLIAGSRDAPGDTPQEDVSSVTAATMGIYEIEDKDGRTTLTRLPAAMEHLAGKSGRRGVRRVHFDPEQTRVLTIEHDGRVRVWRRADGTKLVELGDGKIEGAVFSPDGRRIVTVDGTNALCTWDAGDGHALGCVNGDGVRGFAIETAANGLVATRDSNAVLRLWDTRNAPFVVSRQVGDIEHLKFDATGRWLAMAGSDGTARVWQTDRCGPSRCDELVRIKHSTEFMNVEFSSDGKATWLVASSHDGSLFLVDLAKPSEVHVEDVPNWASSLDGSRPGHVLACFHGGWIHEWDLRTKKLTGRIAPVQDRAWCTAHYVGDGGRIAAQFTNGEIALWDRKVLADGLESPMSIDSIALDAQRIISRHGGGLVEVRVRAEDSSLTVISSPWFARDSGRVLVAPPTGAITMLDAKGQLSSTPAQPDAVVASLAVSRGERLAVSRDLRYELGPSGATSERTLRSLPSTLPHGTISDAEIAETGWIVSVAADGTVTRYDATGRAVTSARLPSTGRVVRSATGDGLMSVGPRGMIFWTANEPPQTYDVDDGLSDLTGALDRPHGLLARVTRSNFVEVYDLATKKVRWRETKKFGADLHRATFVKLGPPAPHRLVAVSSQGYLATYSLDDGKLVTEFTERIEDHSELTALAFTSDGNITTRDQTGLVSLWDGASGKRLVRIASTFGLVQGAGDRFAISSYRGIMVVTYKARKLPDTAPEWSCGGSNYHAVAWSPSGKLLAAAFDPDDGGLETSWICVIDATTGAKLAAWAAQKWIWRMSFRADDRALLVVGGTMGSGPTSPTMLWELPTGKALHVFEHEDLLVSGFSRGTPYVVTADTAGKLRVYDARAGKRVAESQAPPAVANHHLVKAVIDDASGRLVTVDDHGAIAVVELSSGRRLREIVDDRPGFNDVAIAPGGRVFAVAHGDRVYLWTEAPLPREIEASSVRAIAFSPDGQWLAGADGLRVVSSARPGMVFVWDVADAAEVFHQRTPVELTAIAWSDDGRQVVAGGLAGFAQVFELGLETRKPDDVRKILERMAPRTRAAISSRRDVSDDYEPDATRFRGSLRSR